MALVFEPNSDALAVATRATVEGSLQMWLGDLIQVESVQVRNDDSKLLVSIRYVVRRTQEQRLETFTVEGGN